MSWTSEWTESIQKTQSLTKFPQFFREKFPVGNVEEY
uniref:Uncharacterized protein n=1 Tax=Heterorhabditis bacteriophora TaxID=37862 RepID=A0A1I7X9A4_HETBA